MTGDYQPIACVLHERLEFAVLKRLWLRLDLKDGRRLSGHALDVYTRDGAEWLRFRDESGTDAVLRLDVLAGLEEAQPT